MGGLHGWSMRRARHAPVGTVAPTVETSAPDVAGATAVAFEHVSLAFDDLVVLRDLSFSVPQGGTRVLLGGSGAGKTLVLKMILGLMRPDSGAIFVNGQRVDTLGERDLMPVRSRIGMVFQENALFDSLTVAENVGYRLYEEGRPEGVVRARVEEVLGFIGLAEYVDRMPATLSGGQRRRVAIARAMAPAPALLLFDDPTTGLDPIIAATVDDEIVKLRDLQQVTCVLVTHQIRDAVYIATHTAVRTGAGITIRTTPERLSAPDEFMVLHDGRIHFQGSGTALLASGDPYLRDFLFNTLPPW